MGLYFTLFLLTNHSNKMPQKKSYPPTNLNDIATLTEQCVSTFLNSSELENTCPNKLYNMVLHPLELAVIRSVLTHTKGNQIASANILGINRDTLRAKMKKHMLNKENFQ